ncbi:sugar phosphate isomerase/epimerase family protein [Nocardioides sp. NPDC057767]|uniref:sugar phosphate isomerase/epimerase family protein n=1 Tax=unclassified Nocardioides TaxID=2615069 RepID=UPI00366AFB58
MRNRPTPAANHEVPAIARKLGLNRRQLLAATTGMAAAGIALGGVPLAGPAAADNALLIPRPRRGIILYTVRDAISRDPATSPYASGFKAVFEELSKIGYRQIEFAGYNQSANAPGGNVNNVEGAHLLRMWLDDNGLEAEGNHGSVPSTITDASLAAFDAACEVANILGMRHIGTGSDPTGSAYLADWQAAADRWNILGERAAGHGLKLYTHNHDIAYSFLLDSGPNDALGRPTRSSGVRRLEWFLANTDPGYVSLEMDIYWAHVAQHKHHTYTAPDGSLVEDRFDPLEVVKSAPMRFPLFHAKDGKKDATQANGYVMAPFGEGDIDYQAFFGDMPARGYHNPMWEQDTAPGGALNPGQSLALAKLSYQNMDELRG